MANPIFNADQNNRLNGFQSQFFGNGNQANLAQMFNQFASQFKGNPQEQVQALLDSGKMTKEQYEFFSNMANQMRNQPGFLANVMNRMMGKR